MVHHALPQASGGREFLTGIENLNDAGAGEEGAISATRAKEGQARKRALSIETGSILDSHVASAVPAAGLRAFTNACSASDNPAAGRSMGPDGQFPVVGAYLEAVSPRGAGTATVRSARHSARGIRMQGANILTA
jgi:hypothetical protein